MIFAIKGDLTFAAFFVLLGIFFDFFDGFVARLLNVQGELGKQLDSLADMVTSGVVPGVLMYKLLEKSQEHTLWFKKLSCTVGSWVPVDDKTIYLFPFIGLLITLAAAYRLANFNIDERQTSSFIGLPTPAMALVIISLPLIQMYSDNSVALYWIQNKYALITITVISSILMNINIPLFSLKFKNFGIKDNAIVYIFLLVSILLLIFLQVVAIPLIILTYVLLSIIQNLMKK
ncbi:MAG: CDP-alcohol phosphatidyltransferase family protein [Flavobacteriaceae bacterium]|nr:CDP-alcohol phosphatidyltransferase family protein [Flavobacteriaceae bacterium]